MCTIALLQYEYTHTKQNQIIRTALQRTRAMLPINFQYFFSFSQTSTFEKKNPTTQDIIYTYSRNIRARDVSQKCMIHMHNARAQL